MNHRSAVAGIPKRQRQYLHVRERALDAGKTWAEAEELAARVANKARAKLARSGRGPKLVSRGGSRRQS